MEIKINKEVRKYSESIFFGLSFRQFICSVCACVSAIIVYFLLHGKVNMEVVSWGCIFCTSPFAALGFINYNGLPAEKVFINIIKSKILANKNLTFHPTNYYYELSKSTYKRLEKEGLEIENTKKFI